MRLAPLASLSGHIVYEPLLPGYVFIKKDLAPHPKKNKTKKKRVVPLLCPLTVWPWKKQSHLATGAKWRVRRAGKPSDASAREGENTTRRGGEGEEWVQTSNCVPSGRQKVFKRKLGDSCGHDEPDASLLSFKGNPATLSSQQQQWIRKEESSSSLLLLPASKESRKKKSWSRFESDRKKRRKNTEVWKRLLS